MVRHAVVAALALSCACVAASPEKRTASLIDAANAAIQRGDSTKAESLVDQGLALAQSDPNSAAAWRLRLFRADLLLGKRDLPGATEIAQTTVPDGPEYRPLRVRQQYLKARIEYARGRLPQALAIANVALSEAGEGSELKLELGGFAAQLGLQLGRWTEADAQLDAVIAAADTAGYRNVEAMALISQGMGKFVRNRCDEALRSFERVVSSPGLAGTTVHAKALHNSGMCYARLGQFDRAIDLQRRAVKELEARPTSSDYEQALGQLGTTYLHQGNAREGLAYVERAFKVANESRLLGDAALWAGNLAKAHIDLQQWDEAERFNAEGKRLVTAARPGLAIYFTEHGASIAAGRGRLDEAIRLYEEVLSSKDAPPSVLWHAHYGLATIAIAQKQPARATREFDATLDVIEKTRAGLLKNDYKVSYLSELIRFYRDYVETLMTQNKVERALEIADSSRGRVLAERQRAAAPARPTAAALRKLAKETRTVLLSYWLAPRRSYLWIVGSSGIEYLALPPAQEIETLVRQHQSMIANALVDPLAAKGSAGDKLYQILIAPAAKWVPPNASVVIVPDGALHGINFETLPVDGPRRHYWIEDVELQIAPALASLTDTASARSAQSARTVLLVGDPLPRQPEFPALQYAPAEMSSIARHFGTGAVTAVDRDRATPAAYRDARPERFSFIHFAAHATANVESPLDSAVILSGPDSAYKLYARDVAALPLNADLVTVSACRSAGERTYAGEGLIGFSWAFLRAGARRVIAGLWDVSDRSTAQLMEALYANVAEGQPPARALRNAKLSMIRSGGSAAAPFRWGAFELFTVVP